MSNIYTANKRLRLRRGEKEERRRGKAYLCLAETAVVEAAVSTSFTTVVTGAHILIVACSGDRGSRSVVEGRADGGEDGGAGTVSEAVVEVVKVGELTETRVGRSGRQVVLRAGSGASGTSSGVTAATVAGTGEAL